MSDDLENNQSVSSELIIYLMYALDDIRPLSARGTTLLANAIAALAEDTQSNYEDIKRSISKDLYIQ